MNLGFSEFNYQYCYINELVSLLSVGGRRVFPYIPSLRSESKSGFDTRVKKATGIPLFIQFKAESFNKRRGSRTIRYPSKNNFFKFELYKHQHDLLHNLSNILGLGSVFYAAPLFLEMRNLRTNYMANSILANSLRLDLSVMTNYNSYLPVGAKHCVCYGPGLPTQVLSESYEINVDRKDNIIEILKNKDSMNLLSLFDDIENAFHDFSIDQRKRISPLNLLIKNNIKVIYLIDDLVD
jgi:hypothetical protein